MNMELWNKVKRPPATALKQIKAGRLSGMSDINPQWRLEVMTEHFGQCGTGWYYTVERTWTENGANGEVMAFVLIHLHTKTEQGWSAPITGIGGSALVAKESSGLRANDEAYKMATTDALSVAMKQLGIAADIYMGLWDGSKYRDEDKPKDTPTNDVEQAWIKKLKDSTKNGTAGLMKVHHAVPKDILGKIWKSPLSDNLKASAKEWDEAIGSQA